MPLCSDRNKMQSPIEFIALTRVSEQKEEVEVEKEKSVELDIGLCEMNGNFIFRTTQIHYMNGFQRKISCSFFCSFADTLLPITARIRKMGKRAMGSGKL